MAAPLAGPVTLPELERQARERLAAQLRRLEGELRPKPLPEPLGPPPAVRSWQGEK